MNRHEETREAADFLRSKGFRVMEYWSKDATEPAWRITTSADKDYECICDTDNDLIAVARVVEDRLEKDWLERGTEILQDAEDSFIQRVIARESEHSASGTEEDSQDSDDEAKQTHTYDESQASLEEESHACDCHNIALNYHEPDGVITHEMIESIAHSLTDVSPASDADESTSNDYDADPYEP